MPSTPDTDRDRPLPLGRLASELTALGYPVSRQTLHRMALRGTLPAKRVGRWRSTIGAYLATIAPEQGAK